MYKSDVQIILRSMIISDAYRSFIANKNTFTKYRLTQWISKLPGRKEVPGIFHRFSWLSKHNYLQDLVICFIGV